MGGLCTGRPFCRVDYLGYTPVMVAMVLLENRLTLVQLLARISALFLITHLALVEYEKKRIWKHAHILCLMDLNQWSVALLCIQISQHPFLPTLISPRLAIHQQLSLLCLMWGHLYHLLHQSSSQGPHSPVSSFMNIQGLHSPASSFLNRQGFVSPAISLLDSPGLNSLCSPICPASRGLENGKLWFQVSGRRRHLLSPAAASWLSHFGV